MNICDILYIPIQCIRSTMIIIHVYGSRLPVANVVSCYSDVAVFFNHDCLPCRHSDASVRPLFSAVFKMLSHSDSDLLSWSEKDKEVHPQASCLGAPLQAGDELYPDLQDYYLDEPSKRQ